jgi:teichuronic acid biosynthesis glycosyltransferase TuaG
MYNSEKYISETINSVLAQSHSNWEMVIVDDCSTDSSVKIVNEYLERDNRIKLIQFDKNQGAAITRNSAIENSTGRFIAFLDSDDLWDKNKLKIQLNHLIENNIGFSFTKYNRVSENGLKLKERRKFILEPSFDFLISNCVIGCLTVMLDRVKCGEITFPLIDRRQDHGLWLTLYKNGIKPHGINEYLAKYRVRNNSISSNKFIASIYQWKLYRKIMHFNFLQSIKYIIIYLITGIKNRI